MRQAGLQGQMGWGRGLGWIRTMRPGLHTLPVRLLALAVVLLLLLLLGAFHAVVRGAVVQGDARRVETARQSHAAAVCRRLPGRERRIRCRAGIG